MSVNHCFWQTPYCCHQVWNCQLLLLTNTLLLSPSLELSAVAFDKHLTVVTKSGTVSHCFWQNLTVVTKSGTISHCFWQNLTVVTKSGTVSCCFWQTPYCCHQVWNYQPLLLTNTLLLSPSLELSAVAFDKHLTVVTKSGTVSCCFWQTPYCCHQVWNYQPLLLTKSYCCHQVWNYQPLLLTNTLLLSPSLELSAVAFDKHLTVVTKSGTISHCFWQTPYCCHQVWNYQPLLLTNTLLLSPSLELSAVAFDKHLTVVTKSGTISHCFWQTPYCCHQVWNYQPLLLTNTLLLSPSLELSAVAFDKHLTVVTKSGTISHCFWQNLTVVTKSGTISHCFWQTPYCCHQVWNYQPLLLTNTLLLSPNLELSAIAFDKILLLSPSLELSAVAFDKHLTVVTKSGTVNHCFWQNLTVVTKSRSVSYCFWQTSSCCHQVWNCQPLLLNLKQPHDPTKTCWHIIHCFVPSCQPWSVSYSCCPSSSFFLIFF